MDKVLHLIKVVVKHSPERFHYVINLLLVYLNSVLLANGLQQSTKLIRSRIYWRKSLQLDIRLLIWLGHSIHTRKSGNFGLIRRTYADRSLQLLHTFINHQMTPQNRFLKWLTSICLLGVSILYNYKVKSVKVYYQNLQQSDSENVRDFVISSVWREITTTIISIVFVFGNIFVPRVSILYSNAASKSSVPPATVPHPGRPFYHLVTQTPFLLI